MREKHYKILAKKEKTKIVLRVLAGESISELSRITKVASSSIIRWLGNKKINPDSHFTKEG